MEVSPSPLPQAAVHSAWILVEAQLGRSATFRAHYMISWHCLCPLIHVLRGHLSVPKMGRHCSANLHVTRGGASWMQPRTRRLVTAGSIFAIRLLESESTSSS